MIGRYTRRAAERGRLALIVALSLLGLVAGIAALAGRRPAAPAAEAPTDAPAEVPARDFQVRAYAVATGIFARPAPGQAPGEFAAAQVAAQAAPAPLAHVVWTEQGPFETQGWRDLLQVGRLPMNRPPAIDFRREVAVLIWPVAGLAPADVLAAPGLTLRGAGPRQRGLELRVAPASGGPAPATPAAAAGTGVLPYLLATVPRDQWPVPVPPPTAPPLSVALVR